MRGKRSGATENIVSRCHNRRIEAILESIVRCSKEQCLVRARRIVPTELLRIRPDGAAIGRQRAKLLDRLRQSRRRAFLHQHAQLGILHHFRRAVHIRRHHRRAARHRFQQHIRPAFARRRQNENIGGAIGIGQRVMRDLAQKADARRDAFFLRHAFEFGAHRTRARDQQSGIRQIR